jgi:hypothetical protein
VGLEGHGEAEVVECEKHGNERKEGMSGVCCAVCCVCVCCNMCVYVSLCFSVCPGVLNALYTR